MKINENLSTKSGWEIIENSFAPEHLVASGSNFLTGNGYLGYRGTFPEWRKDRYVGCFVSDTYDNADGTWTELCNAPNALYTLLKVDGEEVSTCAPYISSPGKSEMPYCRRLDLGSGIVSMQNCWKGRCGKKLTIKTEHFASYDDLHVIPLRYQISVSDPCRIEVWAGIDGSVWDLNGKHLQDYRFNKGPGFLSLEARTGEQGILLAVLEGHTITGAAPLYREVIEAEETIFRKTVFELEGGETLVMEKMMVVYSSNDDPDPSGAALKSLNKALDKGYDRLKSAHVPYWEQFWKKTDIAIDGDLLSQAALRFNLYHNMIATPIHSDSLPIGARGLSCQAYQGAAFWDQEIFNLPMYFYTMPGVARNILTYRYKTLDGARRKAEQLGYEGAYYAWVSGKTGDELCPSFFFTDVLSGRKIRNHFNDWQMHISPDLVYAIWCYYRATGDWDFIERYGAEIVFEVARFLYSFAYFKKNKNRYEIIRVLGPDEYHENVDNNAFTNYQACFSLQTALDIYDRLKSENPSRLMDLLERLKMDGNDYEQWEEMAALLYLPQPDPESGIIEQFKGYFALEDVMPSRLEERLIDKNEYWGWPNGIAVHTRVIKQADVIQLLALHDIFPAEIVLKNYDFYEPKCQHGSSLSPAVHAIVSARIGYVDQAYRYFRRSCLIDLLDTNKAFSGGTFIGGIHTASCGASWQIVVFGFAGMAVDSRGITFNPALPEEWNNLCFKIFFRGQELHIYLDHFLLTVKAAGSNSTSIPVTVYGGRKIIAPGNEHTFHMA